MNYVFGSSSSCYGACADPARAAVTTDYRLEAHNASVDSDVSILTDVKKDPISKDYELNLTTHNESISVLRIKVKYIYPNHHLWTDINVIIY